MKKKLLACAVALLMFAGVFVGKSSAQTDIELHNIPQSGYTFARDSKLYRGKSWLYNTGVLKMESRGTVLNTYCIEALFHYNQYSQKQEIVKFDEYMNIYRKDYVNKKQTQLAYKNIDKDKLRAIVFKGYPETSLNELREKSGIPYLTTEEATRATQFAIWHTTDGLKLKSTRYGYEVYFDAYQNYFTGRYSWGRPVYASYSEKITNNEKRLYDYLINLEPMSAPTKGDSNILSDITTSDNGDGTTKVSFNWDASIEEPELENLQYGHVMNEKRETRDGRVYISFDVDSKNGNNLKVVAVGDKVRDIAVLVGGYCIQSKVTIVEQNGTVEKSVSIPKTNPKVGLKIVKIDADTKTPIQGVEFEVKQGNKLIQKLVTDKNGVATINDLKPGYSFYTLEETKAAPGYAKINMPMGFIVTPNGPNFFNLSSAKYEDNKLVVENKKQPKGFIEIVKKDSATRANLPGAEFTLYDKSGKEVAKAVSNKDGLVRFENIIFDEEYTFKETKAPAGYELDSTVHRAQVSLYMGNYGKGNYVMIDGQCGTCFEVYNTKTPEIKGKFELVKIDAANKEKLAGAVFRLTNGSDYTVEKTTGKDGVIKFEELAKGNYTLTEVTAPEGYRNNDKEYAVVVNNEGKVTVDGQLTDALTVENNKELSLILVKRDIFTDEIMEGVKFELKTEDGALLSTQSTDQEGRITFKGLTPGKYQIVEPEVVEGYMQLPIVHIIIDDNGNVELDKNNNLRLILNDFTTQGNVINVFNYYPLEIG